ncbi:hypothetical protein WJX73_008298 [Symbiochloris irregularis]|uniref:Mannose-P-dolichol utilization defect 1 protein homolog n=1 Tax=Symbiochloris irregularis TaxID=706552 RepID=A0AAW1NY46_9CHLO
MWPLLARSPRTWVVSATHKSVPGLKQQHFSLLHTRPYQQGRQRTAVQRVHRHYTRQQGLCRAAASTEVQNAVSQAASSSSLNAVLAKLTGYCVLAGACFRSIPQILRIERTKSVQGLSESANLFEFVAYTIMLAYNYRLNYAFNTYGEIVACWLQDIVLAGQIVHYSRKPGLREFAMVGAFAVAFWALMSGFCNLQILTYLQASTIGIISLGGRMPQIIMNVRNGHSGQLSPITCGMNTAGCFARMFTTLVLTQDMLNFWGTAVQAVLNGTLLLQCIQTARMPAEKRRELELDGPTEASPSKAFPSQTANEN